MIEGGDSIYRKDDPRNLRAAHSAGQNHHFGGHPLAGWAGRTLGDPGRERLRQDLAVERVDWLFYPHSGHDLRAGPPLWPKRLARITKENRAGQVFASP